jgi:hypothetical protein
MSEGSSNHEWALGRKSIRRIWPGLTEREMKLILKVVAQLQPDDWIIWHKSWSHWRELSEAIKGINLVEIHSSPSSLKARVDQVE